MQKCTIALEYGHMTPVGSYWCRNHGTITERALEIFLHSEAVDFQKFALVVGGSLVEGRIGLANRFPNGSLENRLPTETLQARSRRQYALLTESVLCRYCFHLGFRW